MQTAEAHTAAGRRVPSAWISRRPRITGEQLPRRVDLSPSRAGAVILCTFGAFWLYLAGGLVLDIAAAGHPSLLLFGAFPLIGVAVLGYGLSQLYERRSVLFGETGVDVAERTLRGARKWSAAYGDYLGVLQREHTVRTKNSTRTYQIVQLLHADAAYDLPLYVTRGDKAPRDLWEALARRLALPALQLDDDRIAARSTAALDASLAEQVRSGDGPREVMPSAPPSGLGLRREGNGRDEAFWIEVRRTRMPAWAYALFMAVPLVFLVLAMVQSEARAVAVFAVPVMAGAAWAWWKDRTSPRSIRVTRDQIKSHDPWPWSKGEPTVLAHRDVEAVRVRASGKGASAVAVESDRGTMHLGQGLSRAELAWLRDFLTASITTA